MSAGIHVAPAGMQWPEALCASQRSVFAQVFDAILGDLASYCWLASGYQSGPFISFWMRGEEMADWDRDEARLDALTFETDCECEEGCECGCPCHREPRLADGGPVYRPGSLPELADWMGDDWIDLVGFRASEEEALRIAAAWPPHSRESREVLDPSECEMAFFNVDGGSWEFYAKNAALVGKAAAHARTIEGLIVRDCVLAEREHWGPPA